MQLASSGRGLRSFRWCRFCNSSDVDTDNRQRMMLRCWLVRPALWITGGLFFVVVSYGALYFQVQVAKARTISSTDCPGGLGGPEIVGSDIEPRYVPPVVVCEQSTATSSVSQTVYWMSPFSLLYAIGIACFIVAVVLSVRAMVRFFR